MADAVSSIKNCIGIGKNKNMNGYQKHEVKQRRRFCLIVFSLFSFSWLSFFQGHLICYAYDKVISSLGGIVGNCNRFIAAAFITVILDLIARWINRMRRHAGIFNAMDYLIPSIILGIITGFDNEVFFSQSAVQWVVAVILIVLLLLATVVIRYRNNIKPDSRKIVSTTNLLILFFEMLIVASLGNTDENLHRRTAMEKYLNECRYEKLLAVGYDEQESDSKIDWLRLQAMYALDTDSLGTGLAERMFQYPISDIPLATTFIRNSISSSDDSLMQVYLGDVAALLERDMQHLDSMDLSLYYNKVLPRYFMQALIVAGHDSLEYYFPDQYREEKRVFESFENVLENADGQSEVYRRNATYYDFHRTYYWFYNF